MTRLIVGMLLMIPCSVLAQTRPDPVHVRYERELTALSPADPLSYFLLAEEIADVAAGTKEIALARRLYVLSIELAAGNPDVDRAAGFPVASSASVGLAHIEKIEPRKRWLLALAGRLDERYAVARWDVQEEEPEADEVALLLAEAIGLVLSGDGSLARERFDDPRVMSLLESSRDAIDRPGSGASTSAIQREAQVWPCPECANARIVADRSKGGSARRLCSTCRGNPGPVIDHDTFVSYLAYQSLLLKGVHKSWSSELAVGRSGPLLDPDVSEIAPTMRIDPELVYYRNSRWVSRDEVLENDAGG